MVTPTVKKLVMVMVMVMVTGLGVVSGFNLNTDLPHIHSGPKETLFGYRVALWNDQQRVNRIVVGAPKGRNTTAGNETLPLGNIHVCHVFSEECPADPRLPILVLEDTSALAVFWGETIRKQGIGFGETLHTSSRQESKLVACAPRYAIDLGGASMQARGSCYALDDASSPPTKITPFTNSYYFVKLKSYVNNHRFTGYAMAGFSASVSQDQRYLFMGAPYSFYGQGSVVRRDSDGSTTKAAVLTKTMFGDLTHDFSSEGWATVTGRFDGVVECVASSAPNELLLKGVVRFYNRDLQAVSVKQLEGHDTGAKYGYSLGVGDVDGDGASDLVVGAPLAPGTNHAPDAGKVYLYYSPIKERPPRSSPLVLMGRQEWGHFGLAVTSPGDLNQDGYDDVVVGAPGGHQGLVFVYSGGTDGLLQEPTQTIHASEFSPDLRGFGFSLDGGVDMDNNGYPDLIIGAPFSDKAVVVRSAPVLTLNGELQFDPPVISLENKTCSVTPQNVTFNVACFDLVLDLQYSAHEMSGPVEINLEIELDPMEERLAFIANHRSKLHESINITSVRQPNEEWRITAYVKPGRPQWQTPIEATVEVTREPVAAPRVYFSEAAEGRRPSVALPDGNLSPPEVPSILDILSRTSFPAYAQLACANATTCFSRPDLLVKAAAPSQLVIGGEELEVEVQVVVREDAAYGVQLVVVLPTQLAIARVSGETFIPACTPQPPQLPLPDHLHGFVCRFITAFQTDEQVSLTLHLKYNPETLLDHLLTSGTREVNLQLRLSSDSVDLDPKDNSLNLTFPILTHVDLQVTGTPDPDSVEGRVNETASLQELTNRIPLSSPQQLGPLLNHRFSLTNLGPSPLLALEMVVMVPTMLATSGLPAIYLLESPSTTGPVTCTTPPLNPSGFNITDRQGTREDGKIARFSEPEVTTPPPSILGLMQRRRRRRQADASGGGALGRAAAGAGEGEGDVDGDEMERGGGMVTVDCDLVPCDRITCKVLTLPAGSSVSVDVSGYAVIAALKRMRHRSVVLESRLKVELSHEYDHLSGQLENVTASTYVAIVTPPEVAQATIKGWHWILIIILSLLIMLILIGTLYKFKFFERQRAPVLGRAPPDDEERLTPSGDKEPPGEGNDGGEEKEGEEEGGGEKEGGEEGGEKEGGEEGGEKEGQKEEGEKEGGEEGGEKEGQKEEGEKEGGEAGEKEGD